MQHVRYTRVLLINFGSKLGESVQLNGLPTDIRNTLKHKHTHINSNIYKYLVCVYLVLCMKFRHKNQISIN